MVYLRNTSQVSIIKKSFELSFSFYQLNIKHALKFELSLLMFSENFILQ